MSISHTHFFISWIIFTFQSTFASGAGMINQDSERSSYTISSLKLLTSSLSVANTPTCSAFTSNPLPLTLSADHTAASGMTISLDAIPNNFLKKPLLPFVSPICPLALTTFAFNTSLNFKVSFTISKTWTTTGHAFIKQKTRA